MEKKVYSAPKSLYMEVSTENLISLSPGGTESTQGLDGIDNVKFESKETSDNVWNNIW